MSRRPVAWRALAARNISKAKAIPRTKMGPCINIVLLVNLAASLRHTMAGRPHTHMWLDHMGGEAPMGLRAPGAVTARKRSTITEPGPDPPCTVARAGAQARRHATTSN